MTTTAAAPRPAARATPPGSNDGAPLLEVRDLVKHFSLRGSGPLSGPGGVVQAVNGVSFQLRAGETLALVGESGCGKTTLARTVAQLYAPSRGSVRYRGEEITGLSRARLRPYRRRIQMMFQDPYASLDPRMRVGAIIAEPLVIHGIGDRAARRARVGELLAAVGLAPSDIGRYPHEFSGGQRQRIALARALAPGPELLIADEPVSALDVSIQSQVLNLMKDLKARFGLSLLFISHDLAVVDFLADRIAVMYCGRIVEMASAAALARAPAHPYTRALLRAVPTLETGRRGAPAAAGPAAGGDLPSPLSPPTGCSFHPRCPFARDICRQAVPELGPVAGSGRGEITGSGRGAAAHLGACHLKDELPAEMPAEMPGETPGEMQGEETGP